MTSDGNTPRKRRVWDRAEPRHPVGLTVRCKGSRVLAVELAQPARLTFTYRGEWGAYLLDGVRFRPDRAAGNPSGRVGPTRILDCPHHYEGHVIDGRRLRQVVDQQIERATPGGVDVRVIEVPALH